MKRQQGLTLIELLIGMSLGLFMLWATVESVLTTKQTYRKTDGFARTQENSHYSFYQISKDLHMAGYRNPNNGASPGYVFTGACGNFNPCTSDGGAAGQDRIAILMDPPPDDGTEIDCTGFTIGAQDVIANVYYLVDSVDGVSSLACRGFDIATNQWITDEQLLVEGIDALQFLYGVGTDSASRYVTASQITDFNELSAVRIGLLANDGSITAGASNKDTKFIVLDSNILTYKDKRVRKLYDTTVQLNNSLNEDA